MEEARYWMWAKSKPELNPRVLPPSPAMNLYAGDSWEEQAFAEDAAGALGGCVWPPRSYSCSFCRRDFRSAQALGGHMNVHRRERAGLKQSPNPKSELVVPQSHALNTCTSFGPSYSSQMCSFLYNNPSSNFSPLSHLIRVSSPPPKINNALHFFSPNAQKTLVSLDHSSWSSFRSDKRDRVLDSTIKNDEKKSHDSRVEKEDCVTEDLSMSLNLVVRERQTNTCSDEEVASCKRRRIEEKPLSFMPKLSAVERCEPQAEVLKLCSSGSVDELDLELRLGDAPKVN